MTSTCQLFIINNNKKLYISEHYNQSTTSRVSEIQLVQVTFNFSTFVMVPFAYIYLSLYNSAKPNIHIQIYVYIVD